MKIMSIIWIIGNSQSGKTMLANALKVKSESEGKRVVVIDGDEVRASYDVPIGFSKQDRWKHNINVAKMAVEKNKDYDIVLVAVICPYKALRKKVKKITKCNFVYLEGGKLGPNYPFDIPKLY